MTSFDRDGHLRQKGFMVKKQVLVFAFLLPIRVLCVPNRASFIHLLSKRILFKMIKCLCVCLLDPSDHIDKIKKQKRKQKNEYIWIKNVVVWVLNVWLEVSELGWGTLRLGGMRSGTAWWLCFGHQAWRAAWKPHTAQKSGSRQPTGLLRSLFPLPCFLHSIFKNSEMNFPKFKLEFPGETRENTGDLYSSQNSCSNKN